MPGFRGRSGAREHPGLKWVRHCFFSPFRFADHGSSLTSAIQTQHHVDPPTPSVTWQSRADRETRGTHGFASPPYDGFASSGMKNLVEQEKGDVRTGSSQAIRRSLPFFGITSFTLDLE